MLALNESYAQLVTTRQGVLYLTRRIDITRRFEPHAQERGEIDLDAGALSFELQRSLYYYESHYDQTTRRCRANARRRAVRSHSARRHGVSLHVRPGARPQLPQKFTFTNCQRRAYNGNTVFIYTFDEIAATSGV